MLEFSSEPKALEFSIDGEVYSLPVSLPLDEAERVGALQEGDGGLAATLEWFKGFLHARTGGRSDCFGDIECTALVRAWTKAREEAGEPSMGER